MWATWIWMNCILQARRPTQRERDYAACPESQGDSMEELGVKHSLSPTVRHFHQVQSCMNFIFFNLHLVKKKERSSETWFKYCIFNSTWTCEKPCSIHCKQSGRWFSKSYETHVRESASWKISERWIERQYYMFLHKKMLEYQTKLQWRKIRQDRKQYSWKGNSLSFIPSVPMKQKKLK